MRGTTNSQRSHNTSHAPLIPLLSSHRRPPHSHRHYIRRRRLTTRNYGGKYSQLRAAMTLFVPLDPDTPLPTTPAFLNPVVDPATEVNKVVKAILKAKRIAFVCGELRCSFRDERVSDMKQRRGDRRWHFSASRHSGL